MEDFEVLLVKVIVLLTTMSTSSVDVNANVVTVIPDKYQKVIENKMHIDITETVRVRSAAVCCLVCSQDRSCAAVNYNSALQTCGKSQGPVEEDKLVSATGWIFYRNIVFPLFEVGSCFQGSCYRVLTTHQSWYSAKEACENSNGHLADIFSEEENTFIGQFFDTVSGGDFFIGGSDETKEGEYVWSDGTPITNTAYSNWFDGEPNNSGSNEDCISMYGQGICKWNDIPCALKRMAVCEYE